jgi:hypothetical protein
MTRSGRLLFSLVLSVLPAIAQQPSVRPTANANVPALVNFNGILKGVDGKPRHNVVGVTFALYREQEGGAPLWLETQNVSPDSQGRYSVELGSGSRNGLPTDVFSSGEARWLGVQAAGQPEQSRVLLVSVPYALKAADAETIGGLPPSAFVLASPSANGNQAAPATSATPNTELSQSDGASPTLGGSGTQNFLPLWTDNNGTLGNSVLFQLGTGSSAKVGVNMQQPLTTLDVNGMTLIRGKLEPITQGVATASKAFNSNALDLEASSFSSTTQKAVMQHFEWQAQPSGNNTNNPGATLHLLFGQDNTSPAETGLSLSRTGIFTFAPGQKFPGTGTVASVGLSAPTSDFTVSGSPITNSGTLALGWNVAPTNSNVANAIVKRDANGSFVAGPISVSTPTVGVPAISAVDNVTGAFNQAIFGSSITGYGVQGQSSNYVGIYGNGPATGVAGTGIVGVSGTGTTGSNTVGVFGDGDYGVEGISTNIGVYGYGPNAVYGQSSTSNGYGVYAINKVSGGTGAALYTYSLSGVSAYLDGPTGHCEIDSDGHLYCSGSKSAVVPVDGGSRQVALYAVESPENWFEDFGSGHLSDGEATVQLERTFAQTVNTGKDYYVFPVPNGDCRGLFVTDKTNTGFTVRELGGGKSNIAFDYRIIARRKGYENIRLADKTNDFKDRPKPVSLPGGQPTPQNPQERSVNGHFLPGPQSR